MFTQEKLLEPTINVHFINEYKLVQTKFIEFIARVFQLALVFFSMKYIGYI